MTLDRDTHVDELIGVYALEALAPDERADVDRHLEACPRCRALAAEARLAAAALPRGAEPVAPPPALKGRLLARIDADLAAERGRRPVSARAVAPAAPPRAGLFDLLRAWSPALALASLVIALALGIWVVSLQSQLARTQAELAQWSQSGMRVAQLPATTNAPAGAQARLYLTPQSEYAMLVVSGLPPLDPNRTYQLWLRRGTTVIESAGVFRVDASGNGTLTFEAPEPLGTFDRAGITVERAGGAERPTENTRVFGGPL